VRFSLPGEDTWSEGKLVLENGGLYFLSNEQSKNSRIPLPLSKKGKKPEFFIPLRSIRDVVRDQESILAIKHIGNAKLPAEEPGSQSDLLLSTLLSADEHVLNEIERELVLQMDAFKFNVYFTHAGEGGVLSMEKNVALEKGLLKIANEALWIIGRANHKRIAWDDIVNVEQKKRSRYKGTEFGALSMEYFAKDSIENQIISTILITQGNTIDTLKRHTLELLGAYKVNEKLPDMENQILSMLYAGALDLSPTGLASTAEAFGLSEEELKNHVEHLSELEILDQTNHTLSKKGIKYVIELSKNGTFGG
jgi:helix-turn-helix protein